jgi:hypothetical protein
MPLQAFLVEWCRRGSQGLDADWLKPNATRVNGSHAEPAWRTEQRERMEAFAPGCTTRPSSGTIIDLEQENAARRILG